MRDVLEMTIQEILAELEQLEKNFSDRDFNRLEGELRIRASILGWTGDPLKQPPAAVLAAARAVKVKRQVIPAGNGNGFDPVVHGDH